MTSIDNHNCSGIQVLQTDGTAQAVAVAVDEGRVPVVEEEDRGQ